MKDTLPNKPRLLIADDDEVLADSLALRAEMWDFEIVTAKDGQTAWNILNTPDPPSVVLLDWQMPGMTGIELCRRLREAFPDRPLYIIILTAQSAYNSILEAFAAGADDFMTKPCRSEELHARLLTGMRVVRLQNALSARNAAYERLLSSINSMIISLDPGMTVRHLNRAAGEFLGIPPMMAEGLPLEELAALFDGGALIEETRRCIASGQSAHGLEMRCKDRSGAGRYLRVNIDLGAEDGVLHSVLLLADDVSGQKNLELQLFNAQKLESIGQLAAGIAHEINTPVQFVSDNMGFLSEGLADIHKLNLAYEQMINSTPCHTQACEQAQELRRELDIDFLWEEIPKALQHSVEGLEKIANIVRAMKEFSHPEQGEMKSADLNKAIQTTLLVARNEWKYVAETETDLDPNLPPVQCVPGEINQVLLNMIVNAAHAIGSKVGGTGKLGKIRVRTRLEGNAVCIEIADDGCGIPEGIRDRIFDPFFTTKEVGKGTGQGLAISYHIIVEKHGGAIGVESTPNEGTVFSVRLPVMSSEAGIVEE